MPLFESNDQSAELQRDRVDLLILGGFPGIAIAAAIAVAVAPKALFGPAIWTGVVLFTALVRGLRPSSIILIRERMSPREFSTSIIHASVAPVMILSGPLVAHLIGPAVGGAMQSVCLTLGVLMLTTSAWRIVTPSSCTCGYEIEGLTTDQCPECGREVDRLAAWLARLEEHAACVGSTEEMRASLTPWLRDSGIQWDDDAGCFIGTVVDRQIALDVENRPSGVVDSVFDRMVLGRFEALVDAVPDGSSRAAVLLIPGRLADNCREHDPASEARDRHAGTRVIIVAVPEWTAQ